MSFLKNAMLAVVLLVASSSVSFAARHSVHDTASSLVGLHERSDRQAIRSITHVDPVNTPWCAAFVNGVLRKNGNRGTGSDSASSFTKYNRATSNPQKGDIVVVRRSGGSGAHVGFFDGYTTKNGQKAVRVIGGNQSNKVSVSSYSTNKVISYRQVN